MSACRHAWLFQAQLIGGEGAAGAQSDGADCFLRLPRCEFYSHKTCSPSFCSGNCALLLLFSHQPCSHRSYHELQHLDLIIHFSLPGVRMEVEAASWGSVSLCVLISTRLAPCVTLRCSCWMTVKQTKTSLEHTGEFLLLCLACFRGSGASCESASLLKYGRSAPLMPFRCHPGQQNRKDNVQKQLKEKNSAYSCAARHLFAGFILPCVPYDLCSSVHKERGHWMGSK